MSREERERQAWLEAVGRALREIREERGLSQERLGLGCGLDRTYVSGIERGVRNPTIWSLARLAEGLDVKPSSILVRAEGIRS